MQNKLTAADKAIQYIKDMIKHGKIKVGDRFPPGRTLAQDIGVSRNTVMDAFRYFETAGIVTIRHGSGIYLMDDPDVLQKILKTRQVVERWSWIEMMQARRVIETGIVGIAAKNANREDKIALKKALSHVEHTGKSTKTEEGMRSHIWADYLFHREIARITHNPILIELHATIKDLILDAAEIWGHVPDGFDVGNPAHVKIVDAIINNNIGAATEAMEVHLQHMEDLYRLSRLNRE